MSNNDIETDDDRTIRIAEWFAAVFLKSRRPIR